MGHPYIRSYLEDIQKRVSVLFQYSYDELGFDLSKILSDFSRSKLAWGIENGIPHYMVGMSGIEMVEYLYKENCINKTQVRYSVEYWVGWALVYLQWYSGVLFSGIVGVIPADRFYIMYGAYHEMDISHLDDFADKYLVS